MDSNLLQPIIHIKCKIIRLFPTSGIQLTVVADNIKNVMLPLIKITKIDEILFFLNQSKKAITR